MRKLWKPPIDISPKIFINEVLEANRTPGGRGRKTRLKNKGIETFTCYKCKEIHSIDDLTIDHEIPHILIKASFGKISPENNLRLACSKCNHEKNEIPSAIGTILKSRYLDQIKSASRYLCNLIRNEKMISKKELKDEEIVPKKDNANPKV